MMNLVTPLLLLLVGAPLLQSHSDSGAPDLAVPPSKVPKSEVTSTDMGGFSNEFGHFAFSITEDKRNAVLYASVSTVDRIENCMAVIPQLGKEDLVKIRDMLDSTIAELDAR